jgi:hypothetical protein
MMNTFGNVAPAIASENKMLQSVFSPIKKRDKPMKEFLYPLLAALVGLVCTLFFKQNRDTASLRTDVRNHADEIRDLKTHASTPKIHRNDDFDKRIDNITDQISKMAESNDAAHSKIYDAINELGRRIK